MDATFGWDFGLEGNLFPRAIAEGGGYVTKAKKSDEQIATDRRGKDRRGTERRAEKVEVPVERRKIERREKVVRRRQIDPTTCERDYSDDEVEFMNAIEQYKRTSGRMFPTCSEMLEVVRSLGYSKSGAPVAAAIEPMSTMQMS
jgi:hypothetical protein